MKDDATPDLRRKRAHVLRTIRTIDKSLAAAALRRWRNVDQVNAAIFDALIFGSAFTTVVRVDPTRVWLDTTGTAHKD